MLFAYAWVLIEPHHHQAFAYLQMNLLYTYHAKNSLQYCLKLSTSSHNPAYNSVFNCKFKISFELKPNQIPPLGIRLPPSYKPLDLRKKMSCTAQSHLNHRGFLNDLRLTSACTLLAKTLPLQKYFVQTIMREREREWEYFPYSNNTWTSTQQKYKIRRVARKALGPSKLATHCNNLL